MEELIWFTVKSLESHLKLSHVPQKPDSCCPKLSDFINLLTFILYYYFFIHL